MDTVLHLYCLPAPGYFLLLPATRALTNLTHTRDWICFILELATVKTFGSKFRIVFPTNEFLFSFQVLSLPQRNCFLPSIHGPETGRGMRHSVGAN